MIIKSLEEQKFLTALLVSVNERYSEVFSRRAMRLTISKIERRISSEGIGFLTKTLPRLGKAFRKCLTTDTSFNKTCHWFKTDGESELPIFLGEFFKRVFDKRGCLLSQPDAQSVRVIQDICFLFYKYKIPCGEKLEQDVITQFVKTEEDILSVSKVLNEINTHTHCDPSIYSRLSPAWSGRVIRRARRILYRIFRSYQGRDIIPKHGPGAVSARERHWDKYRWTSIPDRTAAQFPIDEYYYSSLSHLSDRFDDLQKITGDEPSARVILVPKDSRGPRLISAEPKEFQWLQQGQMEKIVGLIESHPITKWNVFFTDQTPNQRGALLGSLSGRYATLDLKEASDRVSLGLVRLLFPEPVLSQILASRSQSTVLPCGRVIQLEKFAPMGSALCFPVMALTIWVLLHSRSIERDPTGCEAEGILVYGDDVIVPTAYADDAIKTLETFGLLANRDKCCIQGPFRESCGVEAFNGIDVTPIRLKTVLTSHITPELYTGLLEISRKYLDRGYVSIYEHIVRMLEQRTKFPIPTDDEVPYGNAPSIPYRPDGCRTVKRKVNPETQVLRTLCLISVPSKVTKHADGWTMLLRYFTEKNRSLSNCPLDTLDDTALRRATQGRYFKRPTSVAEYTERGRNSLRPRWC